jgi:hypothetical protein
MAALFEKFTPVRVNKDVAPDAVHTVDGNRVLLPGELLDALNCRYMDNSGKRGVLRNTPGNELKTYALASGDNKCIGAFLYEKENTLIYMIWNENDSDRVIEWNKFTNTFTVLLSGDLGFERDNLITQGGVIDKMLIWNDRSNRIRRINIDRAREGGYQSLSEYEISLALKPPLDPPTVELVDDAEIFMSLISDDTWQFAYRYVYQDNEETVFSPLSKLIWPGINVDRVATTKRAINVTTSFPSELEGLVKKIEFAFRRGNNGDYVVFASKVDPSPGTISVKFRNNENKTAISTAAATRLYDAISDRTEAMGLIDSRVFFTENRSGFNENPNATFALSLEAVDARTLRSTNRFAKEGGTYGGGLVYMDDYGKLSFVEHAVNVNVPYLFDYVAEELPGRSGITLRHPIRNRFNWSVSGEPPAYAKKYAPVLSRERYYANYFQCSASPFLYIRDMKEGEEERTANRDKGHFYYEGKVFQFHENFKTREWEYVYLHVPTNLPFVPDSTCFVRFNSHNWPEEAKRIVPVIGVSGNFIIIDMKYSIADISSVQDPRDRPSYYFPWKDFRNTSIEVFMPSEEPDNTFYEVGEFYDVVDGQFSVTSGTLYGDTYNLTGAQIGYLTLDPGIEHDPETDLYGNDDDGAVTVFESPSGIVSSIASSIPVPIKSYKRPARSGSNDSVAIVGESTQKINVQTLDYARASSDFGREHTEYKGSKEEDYFNNVVFGEPYIQNSKINGLSNVFASNSRPIPVERSPIRALQKVGTVLLAIHERGCSSLYIGEGILKQGDDFIKVQVDSVLADDRELDEKYGTINPESVYAVGGKCVFWDAIRGAVVRYSRAGLFPISIYGMEYYFQALGELLFPYRDQVKVISSYDYTTAEFIISFPRLVVDNVEIFAGVTWAFNEKNNVWTTRYSFLPEMYGSVNNSLVSFKDGQLWVHNSRNVPYNNFYGVQYKRSWKFVANMRPGIVKKYLNIHHDGPYATNLQDPTFEVVRLNTPSGQYSYIPAYAFDKQMGLAGKYTAAVLRDVNTPVAENQLALRSGDEMVGTHVEIEVFNDRTDEAPCAHVNVVYQELVFSV